MIQSKHPKKFFQSIKSNSGFSLIEILVALFLVVGMLAIVTIATSPSREKLDENLHLLERAIRFSSDEAVLRNTVTRIHFFLDKAPQEFAVEFGPDSDFIIPLGMLDQKEFGELSLSEKEERKSKTKKMNRDFNKVQEFQEENKKIEDNIRIVAMATTMNENIYSEHEAAIYVYPNGEKDGAIFVLATYDELASLSVEPFNLDFEIKYYPINKEFIDEEERAQYLYDQAKEIIHSWQKN